ncbi:hypothetical protein [Kocuria atrinae]|uniref:hypothetical protein n=1 Tax=Kocuria atrinae TaxID=592377 RepID=UPI0003103E76|nr:hypothetical protein [Kocuria atrinae]
MDGFWVSIDVYEDGIDTFVDQVVPILQERGLYPTDYQGTTLRDHLASPSSTARIRASADGARHLMTLYCRVRAPTPQ